MKKQNQFENITKFKDVNFLCFVFSSIISIDFIFGMFNYKHYVDNGLTPSQISIIMAIASISLLLFDFPSGVISDKFGRKRIGGLGVVIWGIALCIFSLSTSFTMFTISIIILFLGVAFYSGSLSSWLYDNLKSSGNEKLWNIIFSKISAINNFVKLIVNVIVLIVISFFDVQVLFIAGIVMIIVGIVVLGFPMKDNYGNRNKELLIQVKDSVLLMFIDSKIGKIMILNFLSSSFLTMFLLIFPNKIVFDLGFSVNILPYVYFILNFFMLCGNFVYSKILVKRFKNESIYRYNFILGTLSIILITISTNIASFVLGLLLFEVFISIYYIVNSTVVNQALPSESRSALLSISSSVSSIGSAIFSIITGYLLDLSMNGNILLITMLFIVLTLLITIYNGIIKQNKEC